MFILKQPIDIQDSRQLKINCICIALNHHTSFKGLNRPNIYDTAQHKPPKGQDNSLDQQGRNLEKECRVREGSLLPGMVRSAMGAIIDIHSIQAKHDGVLAG